MNAFGARDGPRDGEKKKKTKSSPLTGPERLDPAIGENPEHFGPEPAGREQLHELNLGRPVAKRLGRAVEPHQNATVRSWDALLGGTIPFNEEEVVGNVCAEP